ncbi:MAG: hypothetical protein HY340_04185 [Candidatus Kerfeldbacteria bacterium]|nr:hypothetical protein [Candidatus Kerfeldbacteria bacterium]
MSHARLVDLVFFVEAIVHGSHYRGYLVLNGVRYEYELHSLLPITALHGGAWRDLFDLRMYIDLRLAKDGRSIVLTDQEFGLFFNLIYSRLVEFCRDVMKYAKTQRLVNGFIRSVDGRLNWQVLNESTCCAKIELTPRRVAILRASKFGWAVAQ